MTQENPTTRLGADSLTTSANALIKWYYSTSKFYFSWKTVFSGARKKGNREVQLKHLCCPMFAINKTYLYLQVFPCSEHWWITFFYSLGNATCLEWHHPAVVVNWWFFRFVIVQVWTAEVWAKQHKRGASGCDKTHDPPERVCRRHIQGLF